MSTVIETARYAPEDLLTIPDGDRFELVDGQLVERNMSTWSSYVAGTIYFRLQSYCDAHRLGWVYPEGTSYQCLPDAPARVRRPAVSFIRLERMSPDDALAERGVHGGAADETEHQKHTGPGDHCPSEVLGA